jgi:hypothetical protein
MRSCKQHRWAQQHQQLSRVDAEPIEILREQDNGACWKLSDFGLVECELS